MPITFEVVGLPVAQGSMRAFSLKRGGYAMVATNAKRLKPWRLEMKEAAAACVNGGGPIAGAVAVDLLFRFPRPTGHYGKRGLRPSAPQRMFTRPDVDKLVRAVFDALKDSGALPEDSHIDELRARKRYCADGESPGVRVEIA
jgi:Holliday junction resolvase RusA-like endonuclease